MQPPGQTPHVLQASKPAYGEACRAMLEESTWTPARDVHGQALPFSGDFSCTFEHPADSAPRTTSAPERVKPPIAPDYGEHWYERFSDEIAARDASAVLEVEVFADGRVRVLGVAGGGQKALMGDLVALSHCFESAAGMDKWVHSTHWLAFVILESGQVERVEWVERPLVDEMLDACLFGALRELRFAPETERTIVDVQLELSGVQRLGFRR